MKIALFAEHLNKNYFTALYSLSQIKMISLEVYSSRFLYDIFSFLKKRKYSDQAKESVISKPLNKDISQRESLKSRISKFLNSETTSNDVFLHPKKLIGIFKSDIIIMACSPYHEYIFLFTLFDFMRKKTILSTSWPYWQNDQVPYNSNRITEWFWLKYLKGRKVHTVTLRAKNELMALGAVPTHIPHAVDTSIFSPRPKKHSKIRILFVGRLEDEKGVGLLIKAFENIVAKNIELWVAGDGELRSKVLSAKNVVYKGYIKDKKLLSELYNSCDIFVNPSYATEKWEELFGITIVEAMACGLAVIASDSVGPREVVKHGRNGLLFPQKDITRLKSELVYLINNPIVRRRLGHSAATFAHKTYDLHVVQKQWNQFLGEAIR